MLYIQLTSEKTMNNETWGYKEADTALKRAITARGSDLDVFQGSLRCAAKPV